MARFVAAQDLRTPLNFIESMKRWKQDIPEILDNCVRDSIEELRRARAEGIALASSPEPTTFGKVLRVHIEPPRDHDSDQAMVQVDVQAGRALWIASMRNLLTGAAEVLSQHRWSVAEPHGDEEWPLTDHPVLRLNYYRPGHYDFRGGWGNEGSEIMMPISPRHLLYVRVGGKAPNRFVLPQAETQLVQRLIAERAYRWVFARQPLPWVPEVKPRIVDQAAFTAEGDAWRHWHGKQLRDETQFAAERVDAENETVRCKTSTCRESEAERRGRRNHSALFSEVM